MLSKHKNTGFTSLGPLVSTGSREMMFTEDSVDSVSLEDEEEDQEDLEQRLYR